MKKSTLIARIITLVFALAGLAYLYFVLTRPVGSETAQVANLNLQWSSYGYGKTAKELFNRPHGVAVDKDGNIYVSDTNNQRVVVLDPARRFKAVYDPAKNAAKNKNDKTVASRGYLGVAVADNGNIYIADKPGCKIYILDKTGRTIREISEMSPLALAVSGKRLYAATYGHVVVYDLQGNQLKRFGTRGSSDMQFDFPGGIAADAKGNIYVSDTNNTRLMAMAPDGRTLWIKGKKTSSMNEANRMFSLPAGLTMDDNDILYMVDAFSGTIFVFDTKGKKLAEIGEWGKKEGQFYYPAGITFAGGRSFIVADKFNDRLEAVELTVPGIKRATLSGDFLMDLLKNPAFIWSFLALVAVICAAIIWRKSRSSQVKTA